MLALCLELAPALFGFVAALPCGFGSGGVSLLDKLAGIAEGVRGSGVAISSPTASPQEFGFAPLTDGALWWDFEVTAQKSQWLFAARA